MHIDIKDKEGIMTAKQAAKAGILGQKFLKTLDRLRITAAKAAIRGGYSGLDLDEEERRYDAAVKISNCFKEHGYGHETKTMVAELGHLFI